jgi:hypothetical protein
MLVMRLVQQTDSNNHGGCRCIQDFHFGFRFAAHGMTFRPNLNLETVKTISLSGQPHRAPKGVRSSFDAGAAKR